MQQGLCFTFEALVLFANEILHGHLDILERDVCGTARPHTLAIHLPRAYPSMLSLNEQSRDTVHARPTGTDSRGEVVAPYAIGDPLLLSIDDVMLPVFGQFRFASEIGHITSSIGLGDGKAYPLIPIQNVRQYPVHNRLLAELD